MASPENKFSNNSSHERIAFLRTLKPGARIHVSGVCGTGMAAVAELLVQCGFKVSGSDQAFYPPMGDIVRKTVSQVFEGYKAENLQPHPDCVIIGNSLSRGNPEVEYVLENGLPYASMPEVFSAFLIGSRAECGTSVVVSGTHGKTTTSALIATMLKTTGREPGYFIGGAPLDLPRGITLPGKDISPDKRVVVLEGDEYDSAWFAKWSKFLSYRPDIAIVTSLEFDHADIFKSLDDIKEQFAEFLSLVPEQGLVLFYADSAELNSFVGELQKTGKIKARVEGYGKAGSAAHRLLERQSGADGQELKFRLRGNMLQLRTKLSGEFNALNALVAAAVGCELGLTGEEISRGVFSFQGVKRRQNVVCEKHGITVVEDFAHHPTAVKVTLEGLREKYSSRRLLVAFEPRSNTSRRNIFQREYAESFAAADKVFILDVGNKAGYSKHGDTFVPLDVQQLVSDISAKGTAAQIANDVPSLENTLLAELKSGDVLILMSNGDFGGLVGRIVKNL